MEAAWSEDLIRDPLYRAKFVNCPDIIEHWLSEAGGLAGKDVLEFGCGEGTMALGVALRKDPARVIGVEILDVHSQCLPIARRQIGLEALPDNLHLRQIEPGADLTQWGKLDVIYSWSVFEHVSQDLLDAAFASIRAALKPGGAFFLQISPLYYSPNGSHLEPWVLDPWAHLWMQEDLFRRRLWNAPETPPKVRSEWAVYIPTDAALEFERQALWATYSTLNKITAPQLARLAVHAGFEIVRDYRTQARDQPPAELLEIFSPDVLTTEQIVLLLRSK